MRQENIDKCLDDEIKNRKNDGEVKTEMETLMNGEINWKTARMDHTNETRYCEK